MGVFWGTVLGRKEKAWHHLPAKNSGLFHKCHNVCQAGHLIPGLSGMLSIAKVTRTMYLLSDGFYFFWRLQASEVLLQWETCHRNLLQMGLLALLVSHNAFRVWHSKTSGKPDISSILETWELVLCYAFSDFELTVSYCDHGVLSSEAWLQELLLYKELLWGRKAKALCPW